MEWFQFTEDNEDKTNNINPDDSGNDGIIFLII